MLAAPLLLVARHLRAAGAAFSHAVGRRRTGRPPRACRVAGRPSASGWGGSVRLGVGPLAAADRFGAGGSMAGMVGRGRAGSHRVAMPVVPRKDRRDGSTTARAARDFALTLPRLARSISYRVESGSVKSPRYEVTVVEPPAVAAIAARVEPPAYTKLPADDRRRREPDRSVRGEPGDARHQDEPAGALDRSRMAGCTRSSRIRDGAARSRQAWTSGGEGGSVTVDASRSGPFAVSLLR